MNYHSASLHTVDTDVHNGTTYSRTGAEMMKLGLDTGHGLIQSQLMISHITCVQGLNCSQAFILYWASPPV